MKRHNISRYFFFYLVMFGAIEGCQLGYTFDKGETRVAQYNKEFFIEVSLTDLKAKHIATPQAFGLPSYPSELSDSRLLDYVDTKIRGQEVCKDGYILKLGYWDHGNYTIMGKCMDETK